MADLLKDKRMEIVEKAIAKGKKRQDYKPNRETDKYILDRLAENLPFQRPETDPGSIQPPNQGYGSPSDTPGWRYAKRGYADKNRREILEGWKQFEEDLDTLARPREGATSYEPREDATSYELQARKRAEGSYSGLRGWSRMLEAAMLNKKDLTPQERQQLESLQNALAEDMAAPGAQKDRPGRVQEILEALDLTDPESGGRAFLRELKRRAIDDRLPRTQMGWKKTPGEELLKAKLEELGDPHAKNRTRAMQELGWTHVPKEVMARDQHGNPVPLYVDEMKADREAAAEKAYMQHRRDPMKDTQERD